MGCEGDESCKFRLVDRSGRECTGMTCPAFQMSCTPPPTPSCTDGSTWALGSTLGGAETRSLSLCAICLSPDGGIGSGGYFDCHDITCAGDDGCSFPVGYVCSDGRCILP